MSDVRVRSDGVMIYPPNRWPCRVCGTEWDFTGPDDQRAQQHSCLGDDMTFACACWGGGPDDSLYCVSVYQRRQRFLLQRIANLLKTRTHA